MRQRDTLNRFQKLINFLLKIRIPAKIVFITVGIISTVWFLFRVIPKPSRASYPCVRATAPWASAFVIYLLSLSVTVFSFRKFRDHLKASRIPLAGIFFVVALVFSAITLMNNSGLVKSAEKVVLEPSNQPMGVARGIFPGRVVWVHNPKATNENCTNAFGDGYFTNENTDQAEVDKMVNTALKNITGENTNAEAWDAIFRYYNIEKGKGDVGYNSDEIIFLKLNATSSWSGNINPTTFERIDGSNYAISETSPQLVLAVLRNLVNIVGVAQDKIYVGDPLRHIYQDNYTLWHNEFPNIHYLDYNNNTLGRERVVPSTTAKIIYSDGGTIMTSAVQDYLYTIYEDMEYMINLPTMKGHKHAGVTMFAKNHFGSHTRDGASHLHQGLVDPTGNNPSRIDYGLYRVQVDIMTHKYLGKKNLIYLMDGLFTSDYEVDKPDKWDMPPFNGDWSSSIFISQDPVAIESVGFDFLYSEFDGTNGLADYPHMGAVDDYLHQVADSTNWPAGIVYDPEDDDVPDTFSYGVHEHWNNMFDKQYTRNLGTGYGIELVKIFLGPQITPDNSDLLSEMVTSIYIDSFDVKWFGTDMGISRYDDLTWTSITTDNHLLNNDIRDMAYERTAYSHEIWAATAGGLSVMGFDVDGVTSATTYTIGNSDILSNNILTVGVDIRHNRWIGTPAGISIFRISDWYDTTLYLNENHNWESLTDLTITSIGSYENDSMAFITTDSAGVLRYDFDLINGFTGASAYGEQWTLLYSNTVNTVTITDTIQWFGTPEGAYKHYGNQTKEWWEYYPIESGLVSPNVTAIEIDDAGNIWFGTDKGLSIKTASGWFKYPGCIQASDLTFDSDTNDVSISWISGTGLGEGMGLVGPYVNDIKKDFNGNVWVATDGGVEYFSEVPVDYTLDFTAKRVAFIKTGNTGTLYPVDGTTYTADTVFGEGSALSGWYCIYNGVGDTLTVTGLTPDTEYRVIVFEYSGDPGNEVYSTDAAENNPANFTTLEEPVGSIDINSEAEIDVYPVPFSDYLMISSAELAEGATVSFYNLEGRLCYSLSISGKLNRINTSGLEKGLYILRLSDGDKIYSRRIVKH